MPKDGRMSGLRSPASTEPVRDRHRQVGHPPHPGGEPPDMFFAQGFNAARDRLWQIDLWRKRGLGLLAADFGPGYRGAGPGLPALPLSWRHGGRMGRLCARLRRRYARLRPWHQRLYRSPRPMHPDWLPPEFGKLGTRPAKWAAEDVVRIRVHSWMRNALSEVVRTNVMAPPAPRSTLRQNLSHGKTPVVADGIDLADDPARGARHLQAGAGSGRRSARTGSRRSRRRLVAGPR